MTPEGLAWAAAKSRAVTLNLQIAFIGHLPKSDALSIMRNFSKNRYAKKPQKQYCVD
jgi:hypothetical protein